MIEEVELHPVITRQEDLDKIDNKFPVKPPTRIFRDSAKITVGGSLKALFLKPKDNLAPIPDSHYKPVLKTFDAPWKMFPWPPQQRQHPSHGEAAAGRWGSGVLVPEAALRS